MKSRFLPLIIMVLFFGCVQTKPTDQQKPSIIPEPVSIQMENGEFSINKNTVICFKNFEEDDVTAQYFLTYFKKYLGFVPELSFTASRNRIIFELNAVAEVELGEEGYYLTVSKPQIVIRANTMAGLFYGFQTLYQMMPPDINRTHQEIVSIPCVEIYDYPRFDWRGNMLDCSRHFFDVEFIKKYLDVLAIYKINKFHWHLTDDHGWRIEIEKYPKLTEIGAWRVDRSNVRWLEGQPPQKGEKATYGGFYTKDQIREIVAYAAQRQIDIIPEIEIPGHCSEILAAYPELACDDFDYYVQIGPYWPPKAILCGGNDQTMTLLKDVIDEIVPLFPYEYIHVGGDEAVKTNWEHCPKCQQRIKDLGLKNEEQLQGWMISEIEKHINSYGKKIIGWDEILEGGASQDATILSWRGHHTGIAAAKHGNYAIMAPTSFCYIDYYQANPKFSQEAIGGFVPLKKIYSFEPLPEELTPEESQFIKGGQCNLWAEFLLTSNHVEYMLLPRLCAFSECVWTPKEQKDWYRFRDNIEDQKNRLKSLGYIIGESSYQPIITVDTLDNNQCAITLESEVKDVQIFYTTNGEDPTSQSMLFTEKFIVDKPCTVKTISYLNNEMKEEIYSYEIK